jgi:hypothetical protein
VSEIPDTLPRDRSERSSDAAPPEPLAARPGALHGRAARPGRGAPDESDSSDSAAERAAASDEDGPGPVVAAASRRYMLHRRATALRGAELRGRARRASSLDGAELDIWAGWGHFEAAAGLAALFDESDFTDFALGKANGRRRSSTVTSPRAPRAPRPARHAPRTPLVLSGGHARTGVGGVSGEFGGRLRGHAAGCAGEAAAVVHGGAARARGAGAAHGDAQAVQRGGRPRAIGRLARHADRRAAVSSPPPPLLLPPTRVPTRLPAPGTT